MRLHAILASATLLAATTVTAQGPTPASAQTPQIVTSGRGEVELKPDRAQLVFSVETRASTAASAASENARRQRAVLDTLKRLGIAEEQLQTAALQVMPEMVYPGQGQLPRVAGYVARNSVRVEVLKLEQTGTLVDAGLAKGSTGIGGLSFYSSKTAEARRDAMAKAVATARLDAEAMVKAAGLQLGALIEIIANPNFEQPIIRSGMFAEARIASAPVPTPIEAGEIKVTETVTVRWAIRP